MPQTTFHVAPEIEARPDLAAAVHRANETLRKQIDAHIRFTGPVSVRWTSASTRSDGPPACRLLFQTDFHGEPVESDSVLVEREIQPDNPLSALQTAFGWFLQAVIRASVARMERLFDEPVAAEA